MPTPSKIERAGSHYDQTMHNRHNYLGMPGEIRDLILRFCVVPGQVQLPGQPVNRARVPKRPYNDPEFPLDRIIADFWHSLRFPFFSRALPNPGGGNPNLALGILSANRQAYAEGSGLFWSLNTFFLPHGPLSHTLFFFGK